MKLNVIASLLLSAFLLVTAPVFAQTGKNSGNAEAQVSVLAEKLVQALLKGDIAFYDKCYADDAVIIHGTGTRFSKAQEIENLKSGSLRYDSYDVSEREVHSYGGTVVESSKTSASGLYDGRPFNAVFRISRVWVKRNGNWNVVLFQGTRMPVSK
jgi:ketosteroid isomerase-like protein